MQRKATSVTCTSPLTVGASKQENDQTSLRSELIRQQT